MANMVKTVTENKIVYTRDWIHSEYKGHTITKTEIDVSNLKDGRVTSGSIRYEWTASSSLNVIEARTLKALKQKVDLI